MKKYSVILLLMSFLNTTHLNAFSFEEENLLLVSPSASLKRAAPEELAKEDPPKTLSLKSILRKAQQIVRAITPLVMLGSGFYFINIVSGSLLNCDHLEPFEGPYAGEYNQRARIVCGVLESSAYSDDWKTQTWAKYLEGLRALFNTPPLDLSVPGSAAKEL